MARMNDKARSHDAHKGSTDRIVFRKDHLKRNERLLLVRPSPRVNVTLQFIVYNCLWHVYRPPKEVGL
eukprot:6912621-Prymnesium_polylepis.1